MPIIIAFLIIVLAMIAIMYKTYVGYGQYHWSIKLGFIFFLIISLFAPFINFAMRHSVSNPILIYSSKFLYFLFGFVICLFLITLLRDIIWVVIDMVRRTPLTEMKNSPYLSKANFWTLFACLLVCLYGLYEAEKNAQILSYEISSPKIKKETKIVMLADLHIARDVSPKYVKNLVKRVNDLKPDAIVVVGDIVDDTSYFLYKQMEELKKLQAKYGVYVVLGNHEYYANALDWALKFGQLGFKFLSNYGMNLDDTGIYIAGIPDINSTAQMNGKIKVDSALHFANKDDYIIMLSHTPKVAEGVTKDNVDLQLSAHTHGGQIYPFHYFASKSNDGHLAGFYNVDGVKLYVTRGTRYWGPPMRILAPSEITVFNFVPAADNNGK